MRLTHLLQFCLLAMALGAAAPSTAATNETIDYKELYDLLRTHLSGVGDTGLNRAAVDGLLKELKPRVTLVADSPAPDTTNSPALSARSVFDGSIAYLRVSQVSAGLDKDIASAYTALASSNRIKGLVVDLRFAGGEDYAAAAAVADHFFTNATALIDWGEGWRRSTAKTDAIGVPVVLLVNPKTSSAAEALAGILRQNDIGLLIGTNTAGRASIFKEFALKTGQRIRVAVSPVKVASGTTLPETGLKPDISVDVNPDDERAWYENAYRLPGKAATVVFVEASATNGTAQASTNRPGRRRINEADLVRMQRDGQSIDELTNASTRDLESSRQVVRDPALARAIDLLKGLAVVQRIRSP